MTRFMNGRFLGAVLILCIGVLAQKKKKMPPPPPVKLSPPPPSPVKLAVSGKRAACTNLPWEHTISYTLVRRDDWQWDQRLDTMEKILRIRNFVSNIVTCKGYDEAVKYISNYWDADFYTCIHGFIKPNTLPCQSAYLLVPPSLIKPSLIVIGSPEGDVPDCCDGVAT